MKKKLLTFFSVCWLILPISAQVVQPTPHSIESTGQKIAISGGVSIQTLKDADPIALEELKSIIKEDKKGVKLYIGELGDKSLNKVSKGLEIPSVSGAYYLSVTPKEIVIVGHDDRGTYYGVQTLKQLISGDSLAQVIVKDYPDILFRGSVEGFYGKPWSHRDRLAQLKFYGQNKLNTYIYGPKDDPYHSSLSNHGDATNPSTANWRDPYPQAEGRNIAELASTAKRYKVDFVWAIHPGQDIKWNDEDYGKLINKFNSMYDLGVRSFAVFFDDISGEGTNPVKQAELLNRINKEFVQVKEGVTPLIMCPTEYNKSWANPKPDGYLSVLGDKLDPSIQIMWTGDRVCADITMETLNWINSRIKRPTYIWWNFPVTDYVRHLVIQGPSYGLDTKATSKDMAGFVSNPMENAEASKIALYGVADYTWNVSKYDYLKTWEKAIKAIMPQAAEAYRTFAIHSADLEQNGHGYRRDESWETKTIDPLNYSDDDYYSLVGEFAKIKMAQEKIVNSGADQYLISELSPWLEQFTKLGERGLETMNLIKLFEDKDASEIWTSLVSLQMSDSDLKAYNKHKSGTLVLQPFITKTNKTISDKFYEFLSGNELQKVTPITSFERKETLPEMLDGNASTYFYSWGAQKAGDYVGIDLGELTGVTNVLVEQGRKVGDKDYFQAAVLECSPDNVNWTSLKEVGDSSYSIFYQGLPVEARYVRLRALDGVSNKNWTAIRTFDVNPRQKEAKIYTNVAHLANAVVETVGEKIAMKPILEVVKLAPESYFGIELPILVAVKDVAIDLGKKGLKVEFSADGESWSNQNDGAVKFVRFSNGTAKEMDVKLNKFEITLNSSGDGDLLSAFDKDFTTGFVARNEVKVAVPNGTNEVYVLSVTPKGVAKFEKIDALNLTEIMLKGDDVIREIIFK